MSLVLALPVLVASGAAAFVGHRFVFGPGGGPYLMLFGMLLLGAGVVGLVIALAIGTKSSRLNPKGKGLPFTISVAIVAVIALLKTLFGGWGW